MLLEMRLKDFKSFVDVPLQLSPLTLLVGANGSGKSNLLDGLRFLQGVGQDLSLEDVLRGRSEAGHEVWRGIRGGIQGAVRSTATDFSLMTQWDMDGFRLEHRLAVQVSPEVSVRDESLIAQIGGQLFQLVKAECVPPHQGRSEPGARLNVAVKQARGNAFTDGTFGAHASQQRSALGQIQLLGKVDPLVIEQSRRLRRAFQNMSFLNITASRMRDYVPRQSTQLGQEGENISALVWRLCQNKDQKLDLLDWISAFCAPELKDIDFVETDLGDVMLLLVEKDGTRVPARSVSDGTLRFLGELVALRTAPKGSLVMMEDIGDGLHPTRIHLLMELLESITESRDIQVIASTHSPIALARLSRKNLENAIVFARHPDRNGTVTSRLKDLPYFLDILEKRDIDHLFTSGWLERAL